MVGLPAVRLSLQHAHNAHHPSSALVARRHSPLQPRAHAVSVRSPTAGGQEQADRHALPQPQHPAD
eukprot:5584080-Prymnesium_polylepis.1